MAPPAALPPVELPVVLVVPAEPRGAPPLLLAMVPPVLASPPTDVLGGPDEVSLPEQATPKRASEHIAFENDVNFRIADSIWNSD